MDKTNDELAKEIKELREELRQIREIVGVLYGLMIESDEGEEEFPFALGTAEVPRLNN